MKRAWSALGKRPRLMWAGVAALLALAAAGGFYWWSHSEMPRPTVPSAPLPPLTTSTFLNTQPGVAYLGDKACASCHRDESRSYRQHPMGRSLFTAADAPALPGDDAKAARPFQSGPFHFQIVRQNGRLLHKEWCQDANGTVVAQFEAEMAYAVGSGTQARSFLWQRDGVLFQAPLTWFADDAQWNLSPGYAKNLLHFNRRIDARCLYCHCQEVRPMVDTSNRYQAPPFGQLTIGCERCHGPGERHVARRTQGLPTADADPTIVNPRHLTPVLRAAICEQCHLQGEAIVVRRGRAQTDYRPGLPLHEYVSVFVRRPQPADRQPIVNHVEQMQLSTCFQKSGGAFGCTSCHDPHALPAAGEKIAFYRQRCSICHSASPPSLKQPRVQAPECSGPSAARTASGNDCLACHMPRNPSATATHLAVTDHRVLRQRDRPPRAPSGPAKGELPLLDFHRDVRNADDEELPRDFGLALVQLAETASTLKAAPIHDYLTSRALPLLDRAAARAPDDVPALAARGFALLGQRRFDEALPVLMDALARAPDREETLSWAVQAAAAAGQLDRAAEFAQHLVNTYPHFAGHYQRLAVIQVQRKAWPAALQAAEAALRADPFAGPARALLISVLIESGQRGRAEAEFEVLGVIDPTYRDSIRGWWIERLNEKK